MTVLVFSCPNCSVMRWPADLMKKELRSWRCAECGAVGALVDDVLEDLKKLLADEKVKLTQP